MKTLPKFVQSRLPRQTPGAAEPHPDADLLTAFAERSVSGRERDHIVEHLARCGDCREALVLAFPAEVESPERAIRTHWFSRPVLRASLPRWAVVAAAVLVIASVGTVQYRREHARSLVSNAFRERESAAISPSTSARETQSSSPAQAGTSIAQSNRSVPSRNTTGSQSFSIAARKSLGANALSVGLSGTAVPNAASRLEQSARSESTAEAAADQSSTGPASIDPASIDPASVDPASVAQWDVVDKAKPAFPQAQSDLVPAPSLRTDPRLLQSRVAPRWAISAAGALQRSSDGGKTWLNVELVVNDLPAKSDLTVGTHTVGTQNDEKSTAPYAARLENRKSVPGAGIIFRAVSLPSSSNSAEVWAGGSGGALYHTVDSGDRWSRVVPSADGVALAGDIVSIQFTGAQNGTVTTSNAEVWITADGGQTWHKR